MGVTYSLSFRRIFGDFGVKDKARNALSTWDVPLSFPPLSGGRNPGFLACPCSFCLQSFTDFHPSLGVGFMALEPSKWLIHRDKYTLFSQHSPTFPHFFFFKCRKKVSKGTLFRVRDGRDGRKYLPICFCHF